MRFATGLLAASAALFFCAAGWSEIVIVHLGDSITSTIYLKPEQKIDAVLGLILAQKYKGGDFRNINLARDGEWVESFLKSRYEQVLRKQVQKADVFIIRYGTNDAQHDKTPETFTEDLRDLVGRVWKDYPGCTVILGTGPHIAGLPWNNEHQYGPMWRAIRELGAADRIPVADVYARFEAEHKDGKTVLGKNDNPKDIHPNAKGVAITAEEIMKVLSPVLEGKFGLKPQEGAVH